MGEEDGAGVESAWLRVVGRRGEDGDIGDVAGFYCFWGWIARGKGREKAQKDDLGEMHSEGTKRR